MELYTLTILTKVAGSNLRLCFNAKSTAEAAYRAVRRPDPSALNLDSVSIGETDDVQVSDDYGNTATVDRNMVMAVVFTDATENINSDVDVSFLQQKSQLRLNKKLMADPEIKAAQSLVQARPGFQQ